MPPRKARGTTTTPKSSPTKPSAKARGKRKAPESGVASPSPARRRARLAAPSGGHSDDSDGDDAYRDDEGPTEQFVSASGGDAYMLYSTQTSKTTDALLSTVIDPAFTLASYATALRNYDAVSSRHVEQDRQARFDKATTRFPKWTLDLEQGFNVLVSGVGSKRRILNEYAERIRSRGDVVVVNGYDTAATVVDLVAALEDIVRSRGGGHAATATAQEQLRTSPRKQRSPKKPTATRANGAATAAGGAYASARPVSALESRVRRLCAALSSTTRPVYLVVHSLDGPALRLPKNISLLALLAAQPLVHLVASVDHVRSALLFPTALSTARPPYASTSSTVADEAALADLRLSFRAFTWIHYDCPTLVPYDTEVASLGTLSTLLPPSIFPALSDSLDPTAASLAQSATHVLASVTDRARRLFNLLGQEQVRVAESLPREVERGLRLLAASSSTTAAGQGTAAGGVGGQQDKAPVVAVSLASLKEKATDALIATHADQVDGFLSEFKDHGVVRASAVPPDKIRGVNEDDDDDGEEEEAGAAAGGEWVWIPLAREALEEVLTELGIDE